MRIIIILLALIAWSTNTEAQKKSVQEKALQEIDSLAANSLEFLGKTDRAIMAAGRPASIVGGDKWAAELIPLPGKNSMDASSTVVIGTGAGVIMIVFAASTGLAYNLTYIGHKKAKLEGSGIESYLSSKYKFEKGECIYTAKDGSYVGMALLNGGILMVAFKEDKKELRFEK